MRPELILLIALLLICVKATADAQTVEVPSNPLASLRAGHPRLIVTEERLEELRRMEHDDEMLARCRRDLMERAEGYLNAEPLKYEKVGPRLLHISRDCLERVYALSLAWRLTGEEKYAEAARRNLLAVCAFDDWNPSHFLDTAEMTHAVGIGYDWLYDYLDEQTRRTLREAIVAKGLEPGLQGYRGGVWWSRSDYNWNQVCNGGLLVGALAIAEHEPDKAAEIVRRAVKSLPMALGSYEPEGAWAEGPGYWNYATRYTVVALSALDTALGTDFGLSDRNGLRLAGYFPLYTTGPTGELFNFADVGTHAARRNLPELLYLARIYNEPTFAAAEHEAIRRFGAKTRDYVWYVPVEGEPKELELDKLYRGPADIGIMRSSWDDPDAVFVGVKAGRNRINHSHLDAGSFVMDAMGVRWAMDLGKDNYNLPGYWDSRPEGRRWTYFRLGSLGHNVPVINGRNQNVDAVAEFTDFGDGKAVVDLTSAYRDFAANVVREVELVDDRRAVVIRDRFALKAECDITWQMFTEADIEVREDGSAVLSLGGKQLRATLESPNGAGFSVASAEQEPPEATNEGIRRLVVRLPGSSGNVEIVIRLQPVWQTR
ncbi:MAG: heparinase II/III domain-containing protein [Phycisphaerae bacterium]